MRMLRYYTDIRLSWPQNELRQYLVYIGKPALTMAAGIDEPMHQYRYHVIDMHNVDCETLLAQDVPNALVLAILCDFKGTPSQQVINFILSRLKSLTGEDERGFRQYLDMLEILSDNRDLRGHVKEAENMLTQIDITRMPSYEIGYEKGVERGAVAERRRLATKLLDLLPDEVIAEQFDLTMGEIDALRKAR